MTAAQPILEADGIGKAFRGRAVLKSAGLSLRPGVITALLGRNGVGKTTLLRISAGGMRADYGVLRFKGKYVPRPALHRLAADGLMYSAQESALTRSFSISTHFASLLTVWGGGERYDQIVTTLRLSEFMEKRPRDLSGGERQRVSLGLAILRCPECLLMDEPFAGVAPVDAPLVSQGLELLRDQGTAIAISGHDVRQVLDVSDEVIWMVAGTTHWLGTPEAAKGHEQFRREYLGPGAALLD